MKDTFDLSSFRSKFVAKFPEFDENYTELERRVKALVFREARCAESRRTVADAAHLFWANLLLSEFEDDAERQALAECGER